MVPEWKPSICPTEDLFLTPAMIRGLLGEHVMISLVVGRRLFSERFCRLQEAESVLLESMDEAILENFEQVEHEISKREVAPSHGEFGEFVGDRIIKYNIVNIDKV